MRCVCHYEKRLLVSAFVWKINMNHLGALVAVMRCVLGYVLGVRFRLHVEPILAPIQVICMVICSILRNYCISGSGKINASRARGARARVSVNFRKISPCMTRARRARAGLTVYPPSRTLELLAFDEYCGFVTSAFFLRIKRGWLYTKKESRSIKTAIFIES